MRTLGVYPKYRRDISATMLTFWLDRDTVRVMGAGGEEFADEGKLGGYLADFVEKSAFPETVAEFRRIQGEHMHGTLRVGGLFENAPADVPVLVDATEHNEMARQVLEQKTEKPFGLNVELEEHPTMGEFDPATRYSYLESGGFELRLAPGAVQVHTQFPSGKVLRLHGDLVSLDELSA